MSLFHLLFGFSGRANRSLDDLQFLVPASFGPTLHAWVKLVLQCVVGIVVSFGVLIALKVEEVTPVKARITRLIKRA